MLLEFNTWFVLSCHDAFCIFHTFLRVFKDNDTTIDTEINDSDNDDNDIRKSAILECVVCRKSGSPYAHLYEVS